MPAESLNGSQLNGTQRTGIQPIKHPLPQHVNAAAVFASCWRLLSRVLLQETPGPWLLSPRSCQQLIAWPSIRRRRWAPGLDRFSALKPSWRRALRIGEQVALAYQTLRWDGRSPRQVVRLLLAAQPQPLFSAAASTSVNSSLIFGQCCGSAQATAEMFYERQLGADALSNGPVGSRRSAVRHGPSSAMGPPPSGISPTRSLSIAVFGPASAVFLADGHCQSSRPAASRDQPAPPGPGSHDPAGLQTLMGRSKRVDFLRSAGYAHPLERS